MTFLSFSYKAGQRDTPPVHAADVVSDVRGLPNPYHWLEREAIDIDGRDHRVQDWLWKHRAFQRYMLNEVKGTTLFREQVIARFGADSDDHVFAYGCTGGTHRSVAICELLVQTFGGTTRHLNLD